VPDRRRHRGPHPEDARLFAADRLDRLREATGDLGWLLGRGYSDKAALALVGDRFQLHARQRLAVVRAACPTDRAATRAARRVEPVSRELVIDGFNVLVAMEAALSGGVLIGGADGLMRDLSSVHGSYRKVDETEAAIDLLIDRLEGVTSARWLLDRPVSNSGRVAELLRSKGQDACLSDTVDGDLIRSGQVVASADGPVLDRAVAWSDLVGPAVARIPAAWVVRLG
jgi:hypothetical protein